MTDPNLLRLYASIFMKPRRHERGGQTYPPTQICVEASHALVFLAAIAEHEPAIAQYYLAASALDRSRLRSVAPLGTPQAAGTGCDLSFHT